MPTVHGTRSKEKAFATPDEATPQPMAVRKLLSSGWGGKLQKDDGPSWKLAFCSPVCPPSDAEDTDDDDYSEYDTDDESVESEGSSVTVLDQLECTTNTPLCTALPTGVTPVPPSTPPSTVVVDTFDPSANIRLALQDTPPEKRAKMRKKAKDCHVLIRWSSLQQLLKENMACAKCGTAITNLDRRTIGIATEIDFRCPTCKREATAHALKSNYVSDKSDTNDFIRRERRIDSYELNYRLILACQLMGESQVGGSIIGCMLDMTREAFRNSWGPMEATLGSEIVKIGARVTDSNLKKETLGKVAVVCDDGKARYPVSVSYDMGWQKAAKTYDSLSGQGLMIGDRTKRVVCYKNYSKACGTCERHARKIEANKTPDLPVNQHDCPRNHDGSSKGMEPLAALDCVNKVWTHEQISAFIEIICLDDDASTKAYLSHSFADLDARNMPRPKNSKGKAKKDKRDDKGRLPRNHPAIRFLADLCHRVRTFGKYLWALKKGGKKKSEITIVDCLRLKRNYAWWLFSGRELTFENFEQSAKSPVLHHFNDHSTCGTWCKHTDKSELELKKLKKYRCKEKNAQLYVLCIEIIDRFSKEENLRECHHRMHSQKNEAMNKSIMRYCPKEKTYCRTMSLTWRINLAISIDSLGHATLYEELFEKMDFTPTELTFSGLRRMWRKKEYGRMYFGQRTVKRRRRIKNREAMATGAKKLEDDAKEGRAYSSGMRMRDENGVEGEGSETRPIKRARTTNNNKLTRTSGDGCKCGAKDHKRTSSSQCPWYGMPRKEVAANYAQRLTESARVEAANPTTEPTGCEPVDPTRQPTVESFEVVVDGVQSTSK
jgi:hypothetical protein